LKYIIYYCRILPSDRCPDVAGTLSGYAGIRTLKDEFSNYEKKEIKKLIEKGFQVIALTRLETDPYDLYDRFKNLSYKYPRTLKEFSRNTIELNIY